MDQTHHQQLVECVREKAVVLILGESGEPDRGERHLENHAVEEFTSSRSPS